MLFRSDGTLMSRAATAVATECLALLRDSGGIVGRHVLLLVGAGDNGGDALFAGAVLAKRGVAVFALPLSEHMHEGGTTALQMAHGRVVDVPTALSLFDRLDLVIDGIVYFSDGNPEPLRTGGVHAANVTVTHTHAGLEEAMKVLTK